MKMLVLAVLSLLVLSVAPGPCHAELIVKKIVYEAGSPDRDVVIEYPELDGLADSLLQGSINGLMPRVAGKDTLEQDFADGLMHLSVYYQAFIEYNVFSVFFIREDYYEGAAHPNDAIITFNVDLGDGKQLTLADLFKPGFEEPLGRIVQARIKALDWCPGTDFEFPGVAPDQEFYLTKEELHIGYQKYTIGPGACGSADISVPLADVRGLISDQGPLAELR